MAMPQRMLQFTELHGFSDDWRQLDLDSDDLLALQNAILEAPKRPPVIPGTGGVRKIRFAPVSWSIGKRGGVRVCYVYFEECGVVVLVMAFSKNEKENLTGEEKAALRAFVTRQAAAFSKRNVK